MERRYVCLQVHNDYQIPGGETKTAKLIADLLERNGVEVIRYYRTNDEFKTAGQVKKIRVAIESLHNFKVEKEIGEIIKNKHIDFALIHNTSPIISNVVYKVLLQNRIPIIKYLQNYNMICLNGALDHGNICARCQNHNLIGLYNGCYKESRLFSLIKYIIKKEMNIFYLKKIEAFMPNSAFVKNQHVQFGLEQSKMHVMLNYIHGNKQMCTDHTEYLYFGRISKEKGIMTLVHAFEQLPSLKLRIVGSGELTSPVSNYLATKKINNINYVGPKYDAELEREISNAKCVIVPSEWDEPLPRTILESYLQGTPVIGSNRGGIPEMIRIDKTGYVYTAGVVNELVQCINSIENLDCDSYTQMRQNCETEIELTYTEDKYFQRFMSCVKQIVK